MSMRLRIKLKWWILSGYTSKRYKTPSSRPEAHIKQLVLLRWNNYLSFTERCMIEMILVSNKEYSFYGIENRL